MKTVISKTIATASLFSMLSTSVFANSGVVSLIHEIRNGISVGDAHLLISANIQNGNINKEEVLEYLKENNDARTYKNIEQALAEGNSQVILEALLQDQGAQYATRYNPNQCVDYILAVGFTAAIAAGVGAVIADSTSNKGKSEDMRTGRSDKAKKALNIYNQTLMAGTIGFGAYCFLAPSK